MFDLNVMTQALTDQSSIYSPLPTFFGGLIGWIISIIVLWPVFTKAGRPGWRAIIPIYNAYLLVKIAGLHGATVLLYFIPIVNIIMSIVVAIGVGRAFGKGGAFSFFLLWLLSIIGYLVIGFGQSRYIGDGGDSYKRA